MQLPKPEHVGNAAKHVGNAAKGTGKKPRKTNLCKACGIEGHRSGSPKCTKNPGPIKTLECVEPGAIFACGNHWAHATGVQVVQGTDNSMVKVRPLRPQNGDLSGKSWFQQNDFLNNETVTLQAFRDRHGKIYLAMKKLASNPSSKGHGYLTPMDETGRADYGYFSEFLD